VKLLNVSRQRQSKGLSTATLTASQLIVWENKSHHQEMGHMLLRRTGQISASCTGAALRMELQAEALRFLVHIPCCASSPIVCTQGSKGTCEPSRVLHRTTEWLRLEGTSTDDPV